MILKIAFTIFLIFYILHNDSIEIIKSILL